MNERLADYLLGFITGTSFGIFFAILADFLVRL